MYPPVETPREFFRARQMGCHFFVGTGTPLERACSSLPVCVFYVNGWVPPSIIEMKSGDAGPTLCLIVTYFHRHNILVVSNLFVQKLTAIKLETM